MMGFGEVVALLAAQRGMTQADLARESGPSTSYVALLATGQIKSPTLPKAFALADALGVRLDDIRQIMEEAPAE